MTTTVIIGKQAEGNDSDPEAPALANLEKDKFWPVDIAYFDESKKAARRSRNTASASSCTRTASPATS